MKMEPIVSSETSAIRTQTPGNYPKRNKLHLEHGESLKTRRITYITSYLTCTECVKSERHRGGVIIDIYAGMLSSAL